MPGAPRLSPEDISKAETLLDGWAGKLTWEIYLATLAIELDSKHTYSKVAMLKQDRVRMAWKRAQSRLRQEAKEVGEKSYGTSAVATLRRKLDEVRGDLAEARQVIDEFTEQFKRWQFNAERYGMKLTQLDAPLPKHKRTKPNKSQKT